MFTAILHLSRLKCPFCGADDHLRRFERRGFLQRKLAAWFRLYPWECIYCRRVSFHRHRGMRVCS